MPYLHRHKYCRLSHLLSTVAQQTFLLLTPCAPIKSSNRNPRRPPRVGLGVNRGSSFNSLLSLSLYTDSLSSCPKLFPRRLNSCSSHRSNSPAQQPSATLLK